MFPSTEMEISVKWDRSSANYKNWKRNNEHLTMLSKTAKLGYLCWNRIKWYRFWDTDSTVGTDVHKKKKKKKKKKSLFSSFLQSGRNVVSQLTLTYSLIAVVSFETFFFRVSSFCTNCLRSLIISFQNTNTNRKWSGTRFFIHPGVKQNVPEWLVW